MRALIALGLAASLLAGCLDPDIPQFSDQCASSRDCVLGQCDIDTQRCVPFDPALVMGTFRCDVVDTGGTVPGSELLGSQDGVEVYYGIGAQCRLSKSLLLVTASDPVRGYTLEVWVPRALAEQQPEFSLGPPGATLVSRTEPAEGTAVVLLKERALKTALSGSLRFDAVPALGKRLSGELRLQLNELEGSGSLGAPCESVVDCDGNSETVCLPADAGVQPQCTRDCRTQSCGSGFECLGSLCHKNCQSDKECPEPLRCLPATELGVGACQ